ncbi:somatotropin [Gouania willdenowi]|uniref:Somatotropin n=1 Tax=Gouania willdenowi TaxID=441366 RepID=A0A8C5EBC5_GOUWI|nr:somatotropin-like [Gouania willdenowi]
MERIVLLLSVLSVTSCQSMMDPQRVFSTVVSRVQHLHLLAQRLFNDFESSLQNEEQRQLNKIFLQDFCNSDDIISPIDKQETQRSPILKLLTLSYRLVSCWEVPSGSLTGSSSIPAKLRELKNGIQWLIKASTDPVEIILDSSESYYQSFGAEDSVTRTYELLACFKKDMHKVETYLTVAKCRLSPEANCTL